MASTLTGAEKASVVSMYDDFNIVSLDVHLDAVSSTITTAIDIAIKAQIVLWDAVEAKFVDVEPNAKNFGAKVRYDKRRKQIAEKVGKLLSLPSSIYKSGTGSRLQRG